MDNRIYFRLGGKSYDLTETRSSSDIWYEWVESAKLHMRRMKVSRGALMWLCNRFREASVIKGKSFKTWKCKNISINIYCSLKFNKFGRFISVISVNGNDKSVIILPENSFNEGWGELAFKIHNSISQKYNLQESNTEKGGLSSLRLRGKESYREIIQRKKWYNGDQSQTLASHPGGDMGPLSISLVGRFPDCDEIPTRTEVRNWAQQTWKGIHNLQVYDMNGTHFIETRCRAHSSRRLETEELPSALTTVEADSRSLPC